MHVLRALTLLLCLVAASRAQDVDECASPDTNSCVENADCVNTDGAYNCQCQGGYEGDGTVACTDVDECASPNDNPCSANANCENRVGSYLCQCVEGYKGDGSTGCTDIDECASNETNSCHKDAHCTNTVGGYTCTCNTGFEGDGSLSCTDINECANSTCDVSAHCENTEGSFTCSCKAGYEGDGYICQEIDPCDANPCQEDNTYCYKLPPTEEEPSPYTCILEGYRPGHCSLQRYLSCHELANCTDAADGHSFNCVCPEDSEGDGYTNSTGCILSYKPCRDNFTCPQYGHCDQQTFRCVCNPGFEGDGFNCTDIVDCPSPECDPHALCTDFPGGFTCACDAKNNYVGDGFTCVLECGSDNDCHWNGRCNENNTCVCKDGYKGDGVECVDVNECEDPASNDCDQNANCINTDGEYECECKNGYDGDGFTCTGLPKNCEEIPNFVNSKDYLIDPDFDGPAKAFKVKCDKVKGVTITQVVPVGPFPMNLPKTTTNSSVSVDYEPDPEDLRPLLEDAGFCYQTIEFDCIRGFALFPGTTWYDAYGVRHENWGTDQDQQCACGAVASCQNSCECDGSRKGRDSGKLVNKAELPVISMAFEQNVANKGTISIGPLICASQPIDIPKDCHEAKFDYGIEKNTPLYIDVDGPGGVDPFLVYCDMETYKHVGITEINPNSPVITPTVEQGEPITYTSDLPEINGLIQGSVFCSQRVEFTCKNSALLGDGGYVYGPNRKLDYFPGADGVQDSCGCGITQSCESDEVKCNCNIQDDKVRKDFGLIINKADLPVIRVTAELGDQRSGTYEFGALQCSQKQFGIEPNCEKYRGTGVSEDYTYFIDPDGPGNLDPFAVECKFETSPPMGTTIIHHDNEDANTINSAEWFIHYLRASLEQIEALKDRSTFCTQEVSVNCKKFSLTLDSGAVTWEGAVEKAIELAPSMDSCGVNGTDCACDGVAITNDTTVLQDLIEVPVRSMSFGQTLSQSAEAELTISLGPLICSEVFPTCAMLKQFIDGGLAVEGEADVINGVFTIDPDGPGGVDPFVVRCQFPATIVDTGPGSGGVDDKDPDDPDSPTDKCFDISYTGDDGSPISPEQMTALVQRSEKCTQTLELECQNSPATGQVNYTSCDGTEQPGWAGSYGADMCACGVNGNCDGGNDQKCNCDVADDQLRKDGGNIIQTDRLPVCQVCLSVPPPGEGDPADSPTKMLRYKLGKLTCNGRRGTSGQSCQQARRGAGGSVQSVEEVGLSIDWHNPTPVGCRFYPNPPIGELVVKPEQPVNPPDDENPLDVTIVYISINIDIILKQVEKSEYCSQNIFLFCTGNTPVILGNGNYWYDFDDEAQTEWEELPANGDKITEACEQNQALCQSCGRPKGYKIVEVSSLPVKRVVLAVTGVTLVVGELGCFNLKASCQHISEGSAHNVPGSIGGKRYVIDPDAAGTIEPFAVNCDLDFPNKIGVTEVPVEGQWVGTVTAKDHEKPAEFYLPVNYNGATPEQVDSLTGISDFCWQNVKYECRYSPLLRNGDPASMISLYGSGNATSFGTGPDTDFPGCACEQTGTCLEGYTCNCDALRPMSGTDQGAVTDTTALPITGVYIGGQVNGVSSAEVSVTNIRCTDKPVDPPRDCADAMKRGASFGVDYSETGEYLISPDPTGNIKPFMVRCDFSMVPGVGVTVVKPTNPPNKPQTHKPGDTETEKVEYHGPTDEQIKALIEQSAFCYQGVRYDCQGSVFFSEGSYWITAADGSKTKRTFWGGGEPGEGGGKGFCACGVTDNCGGQDSASNQRARHCNCDVADGEPRSDAGIIDAKEFLPVGSFTFGRFTTFNLVNLTIGDLFCTQDEIHLDECALGFHDCHDKADCVNTDDGYRCVCQPGWQGKSTNRDRDRPRANGRECIDDDECSWNPCPFTAYCTNLPGSFNCTCKEGYEQISPMECRDINECADPVLNDCHENARCQNLQGSYRCACKRDYRGDGKEVCKPVGQCACFGDPHCTSFDHRWLHFQGDCEYIMSKDGCGNEPETFRVEVQHWKRENVRTAYYSWIKTVRVFTLGYNITLRQGGVIEVNGVVVRQFYDTHLVSVVKAGPRVRVLVITGLEVTWDGQEAVEIFIPEKAQGKTCGLCGNYNGDSSDDWELGPACPALAGQQTDNYDQFGRSWVIEDTGAACPVDCSNTPPPNNTDCNVPQSVVEQECDKLLERPYSPFMDCLSILPQETLEQLRFSCVMDGCLTEDDLSAQMCEFAKVIFDKCALSENVKIDGWRQDVDACEEPVCENNMVYKTCGPVNPATCLNSNVAVNDTLVGDVCAEGCFCPGGMLMEDDKCLEQEQCGCFYENEYLAKGDIVFLPNCQEKIECLGQNNTVTTPVECQKNSECRMEDGVRGCFCEEGYLMNEQTGLCESDGCKGVVCNMPNSECKDGECVCQMGYMGDCNQCEDVDECATGTHNCDKLGQGCVNSEGSFACVCRDGFIPAKDGCDDIDECAYDIDGCGANAECVNTLGGFRCECCAGYKESSGGDCVRDPSTDFGSAPAAGQCCACRDSKCEQEGKVCGSDGITYNSYRSLAIKSCKAGDPDLTVSYPGPCQGTCSTVICEKQYATCEMDENGRPQCGCPTCEDSSSVVEEDMVCATNKITYISVCHMKKDSCEAEFETEVEVESTGKPCGPGSGDKPGPWSEWGDCSENCKQGEKTRTRETNGLSVHANETVPCYNTCDNGPCTQTTCTQPAQVCTADEQDVPSCSCPVCVTFPEQPVCGRLGNVVQTYENECELDKAACEEGQEDYEVLEENACEEKPRECGRIRNFKVYKDENGCMADRSVDMGFCYGGCDDKGELCCFGVKQEFKFVILECPDGKRKNKFLPTIQGCQCITQEDAYGPSLVVAD